MANLLKFLFYLLLLIPLAGFGERKVIENPLTAVAEWKSTPLNPGETGELMVHLELYKDHHAYLDQFKFETVHPDGLVVKSFDVAPIVTFFDKFSKRRRHAVKDRGTIRALVELPLIGKKGENEVELLLTYQACTDDYCLLPKQIPLKFSYQLIKAGASAPSPSNAPFSLSFSSAMAHSWWLAFLVVFIAGVLTSFTPCVFPMIPITIAILGSKTAGRQRISRFVMSAIYVLGIAVTYSILGLVAASSGMLFGSLLGHPVVVGFVALVFVLLALSMYGLFDIQAPLWLVNRLGKTSKKSGFVTAFVSGTFAGIVASPCVGPVLIGVLTFVAQTQNLFLGFWLLFTFAIGMGLLFLILGAFSDPSKYLPQSGAWMEGVKFIFGSTMLFMAFYYLKPIVPKMIWLLLMGLAVMTVAIFFGTFSKVKSKPVIYKLRTALMILAFLVGAGLIVIAVIPQLNQEISRTHHDYSKVPWQPMTETNLNAALNLGRPVIIDFYADWCAACKELDQKTFSDPKVQALTGHFAWLQFDATTPNQEFEKLKAKYQILGLPHVVFYDEKGQLRQELTLTGFEDVEDFIKRLQLLTPTSAD